MRDFNAWVKAQLKKGYSASQIKAALSRRGYPSRAVAEVDKMVYPELTKPLSSKKTPRKFLSKSFALIILVIALVFVLWFPAASFFSKEDSKINGSKIEETPDIPIIPDTPAAPATQATEPTPGDNGKIKESGIKQFETFCSEFSSVESEVTCEEAVSIATAKYSGVVQEIEQGTGFRKIGETAPGKDIWRIEIKLDKPVENNQKISDKVSVFLERKTGEELGASYR